jgi:drug/metabolite transporter (DMT)-like permease
MTSRLRFVAVLVATGAAWGSTQPLGKIAVSTGHGHFALIFWQLVIGALLLGAVLLVRRQGFAVTRDRLGFAVLIAVIGTLVPNSTFYISVAQLPSGIMSIIIATVPLLSFPLAVALGMDRFGALRALGLVCGIAGVALIALPEASLPSPAMAAFLPLAMVGPLFYAVEGNVVARWGTWGMSAVQTMFLVSAVGAVMALPLAVLSGQWFDPWADWGRAETALVASSVAHALAYATYVWLAAQAGAVFAAQTGYIVTGTGVIWAMLLLGERFSPFVWAALGVMMLGLFLVQPRGRSAQAG